jgi:glycerophosphoryl diester phosphodiesterase
MRSVVIIWIGFLFYGCTKDNVLNSSLDFDSNYLIGTSKLPVEFQPYIQGIYNTQDKNAGLGNHFVLKWTQNKLSLFSNLDGIYAIMNVGVNYADSSIKLAGYWRSPLVDVEGKIYLTITKENGAVDILRKKYTVSHLVGSSEKMGDKTVNFQLNFERLFSNKVVSNPTFSILAHRAGGRNSDRIPYAENSLNLVKHAAYMGSTGVEIDIKLTKDNIPVIYHDDDINIRLTMKGPVVGNVEDFNFEFLSRYVRLVDGQKIPSLEEMLNTIIDSTDIKFVWLDNKGGNERFFNYTQPIIQKTLLKAKNKNRAIFLLNGIPTDEVAAEFAKIPNFKEKPSLCEISLDKAKEMQSIVYAPRWTLGTLDAEVAEAHSLGMKVVTWTVDLNTVMRKYLFLGDFDGILTNYPSILAYEFYTQE